MLRHRFHWLIKFGLRLVVGTHSALPLTEEPMEWYAHILGKESLIWYKYEDLGRRIVLGTEAAPIQESRPISKLVLDL